MTPQVDHWIKDAAAEVVKQLEVDTAYTDETREYETNWIAAVIAAHAPTPAPGEGFRRSS